MPHEIIISEIKGIKLSVLFCKKLNVKINVTINITMIEPLVNTLYSTCWSNLRYSPLNISLRYFKLEK